MFKDNSFLSEIVISLIMAVFLILLGNPLSANMSKSMHMAVILGLSLIFILFASFIWKEKVKDEREIMHRYIASRFAYITAVVLMTVGVIAKSLQHEYDRWLIFTLLFVVLAKVIGLIYGHIKH
jgi:heme A synthase